MWFRNLLVYRLKTPFKASPEALHETLAQHPFQSCSGLQSHSMGWAPPAGRNTTQLAHAADGRVLICQRREDRLLPASVIREQVETRAEEISDAEARPVGRKERQRLRDEILVDLLPRAFTRSTYLHAYIDPAAGWIVVDTASANRAEELLSALREALGSLPLTPLSVGNAPAAIMTRWLAKRPPKDFTIGDECELREPAEAGGVMRARRLDLGGNEVRGHLDAGMLAARVAVQWQEQIQCVLGDDLAVRRLRFLDSVIDEASEVDDEDPLVRFDTDFALMGRELGRFLPALIEAYGGLAED